MSGAEILDRCRVEILIDHRGTDVRVTGDCGRVSKLLSNRAHDRRDRALGVGFRLGRSAFGQCDGSDQGAAPSPKVLRRELLADRKSTRLNSSHLVISYAVFCLKKKKNASIVLFCTQEQKISQCRST